MPQEIIITDVCLVATFFPAADRETLVVLDPVSTQIFWPAKNSIAAWFGAPMASILTGVDFGVSPETRQLLDMHRRSSIELIPQSVSIAEPTSAETYKRS